MLLRLFHVTLADEDAYRKVVDIENDLEESINLRPPKSMYINIIMRVWKPIPPL